MSARPDEAAVLRSMRPPCCYWSNPLVVALVKEVGRDLAEGACGAIAADPRAVRAILRRARELGSPACLMTNIHTTSAFVSGGQL